MMKSKNIKKYLKALLATSALAVGAINTVAEGAANVVTFPTGIGASFSNNVGWSPRAPIDGDSIGTIPVPRTIFADVTNRQIGFMVRSAPNAVTAPVYIFNDYTVFAGMPVPFNDPIRQTFMTDGANFTLFTNAANPSLSYSNIYFNGQDIGGSGAGTVSPNSRITFTGDAISSNYQLINLYGTGIAGGAGILDLVGTPTGTNITFTATIDNLRDIYVRANNFASFGFSATIGRNVVLYNNATYQLASGTNLTAATIQGDAAGSNTHLIMANNNVIFAQIGQGSDVPVTDAKLLSGTGQFSQAVRFTGDVTQSANTTLTVKNNFAAARLVALGTGQIFQVNTAGISIIDANIGSNGNIPIPFIQVIGEGIGEFKQDVNVANGIGLGINSTIRFDNNVSGPQLFSAVTGTTVEFANINPVIGNIIIGPGGPTTSNNITNLKLSGNDVTLSKLANVNNINFSNTTLPSTLTIAATQDLGAVPITTAATTRIHNINTSATQNISGSVGTAANPLGYINLNNNNTINVNTINFYSGIKPLTNGTGIANLNSKNGVFYDLGDSTHLLSTINYVGSILTQNGSAYANTMNLGTTVAARLTVNPNYDGSKAIITVPGGFNALQNSTLILNDYVTVNGNIVPTLSSAQLLIGITSTPTPTSATVINGNLGASGKTITLQSEGKLTVNGNAYLSQFGATKNVLAPNITTFNSAVVSIDNRITFATGTSDNIVNFANNATVNYSTISPALGGTVNVGANSTFTGDIRLTAASYLTNLNFTNNMAGQNNTTYNAFSFMNVRNVNVADNSVVTLNTPALDTSSPTNLVTLQGANSQLIFPQNVTITGTIVGTANTLGQVTFNGSPTINGTLGQPGNNLKITRFNANANLTNQVYTEQFIIGTNAGVQYAATALAPGQAIIFDSTGTTSLVFPNNITLTGNVITNNPGTGTLTFNGAASIVVGNIGTTTNKINKVNFNGASATLSGNPYATEIDIAANASVNLNSSAVATTNGIIFQGAGGVVNFGDNSVLNSSVLTLNNNTGTISFGNNPTINSALGSNTKQLSLISFNGNATLAQAAYSQEIDIAAGKTVNFNVPSVTTTNGVVFQGTGAEADFTQNVILTGPVLTTTNNTGTLKFFGNTTATGPFGAPGKFLALVQFNNAPARAIVPLATSSVSGNVYATEVDIPAGDTVNFNAAIMQTTNGLIFQGAGATANFTNVVTISGPVLTTVNNTGTLNFATSATLNNSVGDSTNLLTLVNYEGNSTQLGDIYANNITVTAIPSSSVILNVKQSTSNVSPTIVAPGGIKLIAAPLLSALLRLDNNATVKADITATGNKTANIQVFGGASFTGNIGDPTISINNLQLQGNVNVQGNVYVDTVVFDFATNPAVPNNITFNSLVVKTNRISISKNIADSMNFVDNANLNLTLVTGLIANVGNVNFGANSTITGDIGSTFPVVYPPLANINFNGDNTDLTGNLLAQNINIVPGATITLNSLNVSSTGGLMLQGVDSTVIFNKNIQLDASVLAAIDQTGTAIFNGTLNITGGFGDATNSLALVSLNGNTTINTTAYTELLTIGKNATVTYNPTSLQVPGGIELQEIGANLIFPNDINLTANVTSTQNNRGTLTFDGITNVTGNIGDQTNELLLLNLNADATLTGDIYAQSINIAGSITSNFNSSVVKTSIGIILQDTDIVANFADGVSLTSSIFIGANDIGNVNFLGTATINGDIANNTNMLSLLTFAGNATLNGNAYSTEIDISSGAAATFNSLVVTTVNGVVLQGAGASAEFGNNIALNSDVITNVDNTGTVIFNNNPAINGALGSAAQELALISFKGDAHVESEVHAHKITIAAGKTVDFDWTVVDTTDGLVLEGAGATADFNNDVTIDGPILTLVNHTGRVNFLGTPIVNDSIGDSTNSLALVYYGKNATQYDNIYTDEIDIAAGATVTFNTPAITAPIGVIFQGAGATADFVQNITLTAPVLTTTNNTGTVRFYGNTTASGPFGSLGESLALIQFNGAPILFAPGILAASTINGDVYAAEVNIASGENVTFNSSIVQTTNGIIFQGPSAFANFAQNVVITSPMLTTTAGTGVPNILAPATITGDMGSSASPLELVNYAANSTQNGDVYANEIDIAAGAIVTFNTTILETANGIILQGLGAEVDFAQSITFTSPVLTTTPNTGIIRFLAPSIASGNIGDNGNPLELVSYEANSTQNGEVHATEIDIASEVIVNLDSGVINTSNGIVLQGTEAAVVFGDNSVIGSNIITVAPGAGTATFGNNDVMTGNIGDSVNPLTFIIFSGANNSVTGDVYATEIDVAAGGGATLNSVIVQTTNGLFLEGVGSTVTFGDNAQVYSSVYTTTTNTGSIIFGQATSINGNIGSIGLEPELVNFAGNNLDPTNVQGDVYAKRILINENSSVNFNGNGLNAPVVYTTDRLEFEGAGATATFADSAKVNGIISTQVAGAGNVIFQGNIDVNVQIGNIFNRVDTVNFQTNDISQVINLNQDIYANNININPATINISDNRTLYASSVLDSPTINFGQNSLIFTGGNSEFIGNPVFNVFFDDLNDSHIVLTQSEDIIAFASTPFAITPFALFGPDTIDLTNVGLLTFNINDQAPLIAAGSIRYYYFYIPEDLTNILYTADNKVVVNSNNIFAKWYYHNGVLYQERDVEGGIGVIIGGGSNPPGSGQFTGEISGDALAFLNDLRFLASGGDLTLAQESLLRVLLAVNPTGQALLDTIGTLNEQTERRIDNKVFEFLLADSGLGVAAGDKIQEDYAVWVEPFYNKSFQKMSGMQSGYTSKAQGLTLGLDTSINEKTLLGVTASYIQSKLNYKNIKSGDRSNIDSLLFSLYGMHEIHDNWFTQGIFSLGINKVENKKPRVTSNGTEIAKGKYKGGSYGIEIFGGYKCNLAENTVLTPMLGTKYSRFNAENYTEKQTTNLNLRIKKKAFNKVELLVGAKLNTSVNVQDYTLTPQVHAFVDYDVLHKSTKALVNLEGSSGPFVPFVGKKSNRFIYNTGGAFAFTKDFVETELTYDFRFTQKYKSHQGALKVRVKF